MTGKNEQLTNTMLLGLQKMGKKLLRATAVMAEPNENTGKALERRGMVELVDQIGGWRKYQLTELGRSTLEKAFPTPPQDREDKL